MKKTISLILSLVMLLSVTAGLSFSAQAKDYQNLTISASLLEKGDTFQMGVYPQTEVKDAATKTALGKIPCTMKSYWYMKNSNSATHKYTAVDMSYADIAYNNAVYRKVTIKEYRPEFTNNNSTEDRTNQDNNGYTLGTYYFKWEPIVWRVIEKGSKDVYVLSHSILNSQPYNNYEENTSWENCSLRSWLNKTFIYAAFSKAEMEDITSSQIHVENCPSNGTSGGNDTIDKLWVLTYSELKNSAYGFSTTDADFDDARRVAGTDYAKCEGLFVETKTSEGQYGKSYWWQRTVGAELNKGSSVNPGGWLFNAGSDPVNDTSIGVRPAFKLKLDAVVEKSDYDLCKLAGHDFSNNAQTCRRNCGAKNPNYKAPEVPVTSLDVSGGKKITEAQVEKFITTLPNDEDAKGVKFSFMLGRQGKVTNNSINIKWNKAKNASYYIIYGNKCGAENKYKKLAKVTALNYTHKGLEKNTYYKYIISAFDKKGNLLGSTNTIHVATLGGKKGNCTDVITKAKKNKVTVKKNKTFKLAAKGTKTKKGQTIQAHRTIRYECSNTAVATVSKKGVIKGKKKGTCYVYAFAQNGMYKKIKVTVK